MIVDSHAHIFQHWAGACGHPSREIHRKFIQKVQTRPAAKVFRAHDGKEVTGPLLFREGDNSWAGLKGVNFRVGVYGQLDFTLDGEDYYVQYMPVGMQQIVAPPELMLAQMTYARVDHCILQAGGGYGAMNDYNAFAQQQYPSKFTGLLNIDEPRADTDGVLAELERAYRDLGLRGVYYGLDTFARYGFDVEFNDRRFDGFWSALDRWALPVFIEAPPVPHYDEPSYRKNMVRLTDLMDRFDHIKWLLVMGPPVRYFARDGRWDFSGDVMAAYRHDNLWLELMFPIAWGGVWDYPYPEAQALIRDLRDTFGASKLVWGSDMPNVERFCTYTQCVDYVRRHCSFLAADEKNAILGGNLDRMFAISERLKSNSTRRPSA